MGQRRFHYEKAFEHVLRANRVPVVVTDESRKALFPIECDDSRNDEQPTRPSDLVRSANKTHPGRRLASEARFWGGGGVKSFDFLLTGPERYLIVDVKGRRLATSHQQNWVTRADVEAMKRWQATLGGRYRAVFVFVYFSDEQPADTAYEQSFYFENRWYGLIEIEVDAYERHMRPRSKQWDTVCLSVKDFRRLARSFSWQTDSRDNVRTNSIPANCPVERSQQPPGAPRDQNSKPTHRPAVDQIVAGIRAFSPSLSKTPNCANANHGPRVRRSSPLASCC